MNLDIAINLLVANIPGYLWPFIRIGAFVMVMPIIGATYAPMQMRVIIVLALTLLIGPILPETPDVQFLSLTGVILIIQEIVIGIAMGFAVQVLFDAIALGGQVISMSMGLGFAVFLDRVRGVNIPVLGQLFLMLGMLIFLSLDGHLTLIQLLAESFQLLPISLCGLSQVALSLLIQWSGQVFVLALKIALPALTALVVVNLSFGVTSRAAPTLNLFAVGFPISMLLGFVAIYLSMGSLSEVVSLFLGDVLTLLRALLSS